MRDIKKAFEQLEQIDNLPKMSYVERMSFLKESMSLGTIKGREFEPSHVTCPHTKLAVKADCGLKKCPFWVKHKFTKNCALEYMHSIKQDKLTVEQVSFLFEKNLARVESINKDALKLIQRQFLKDLLVSKEAKLFNYVEGFCVTCQSKLNKDELEDNSLSLGHSFGYCSKECKKQKPPDIWKIERYFSTDLLTLIKHGTELFHFYYLEEVLGFQPNVLRNRLEKLKKTGIEE